MHITQHKLIFMCMHHSLPLDSYNENGKEIQEFALRCTTPNFPMFMHILPTIGKKRFPTLGPCEQANLLAEKIVKFNCTSDLGSHMKHNGVVRTTVAYTMYFNRGNTY